MILLWKAVVLEMGVKGLQADPQKFWFAENLGKSPENPGKIGAQRCLASKHGAQGLQKKTWRPCFGGCTNLCGRKFVGRSCTKNFSRKFGEIRAKSFAHQKFAGSYTYDEKAPPPRCLSFERVEGEMLSPCLHSPASLCILFYTHSLYSL